MWTVVIHFTNLYQTCRSLTHTTTTSISQKLQQQLQKQKQQKDKKKSRKHNKLVNLYEEDSTKTTTTEENDEDDDDILDMSVLQSVQEHDENTQKLLSKDGRALTAAGKKRKFSEESMLFKSATREEMNQHKKRRIFWFEPSSEDRAREEGWLVGQFTIDNDKYRSPCVSMGKKALYSKGTSYYNSQVDIGEERWQDCGSVWGVCILWCKTCSFPFINFIIIIMIHVKKTLNFFSWIEIDQCIEKFSPIRLSDLELSETHHPTSIQRLPMQQERE